MAGVGGDEVMAEPDSQPVPLEYKTPEPADAQRPSAEEYAAAKWFSIGFLAITGVLMLVGFVAVLVIAYHFVTDILQ
jgi:hypothetical protein